ncbi:MAG: hypothetical protein ACE5GW_03345 [Planctomycetota bacterium]
MRTGRKPRRAAALLIGLALAATITTTAEGDEEPGVDVDCRVLNVTPDGVYVNAGSDRRIRVGDTGLILRDGDEIARVQAVRVTRSSSLLTIVSVRSEEEPVLDDRVLMRGTAPPPAGRRLRPPPPGADDGELPFVPLLTRPPPPRKARFPKAANLFHGRVRMRQTFQGDAKNDLDLSRSRLTSNGSLERIAGAPWSLQWSGDLSFRTGSGFSGSADNEDLRFDLTQLTVSRQRADGGFLRLGRFLPPELPAVGYLDGTQMEWILSEKLHAGAMLGYKPARRDLEFSAEEPTAVGYASVRTKPSEPFSYSGTLGVLGSLFEGNSDRLALLLDQRATLNRALSFFWTSEVDVDVGGAETRSGASLSRLDVSVAAPIVPQLAVRAGADHFQRPDTQAERDALGILADDSLFDGGFWRYWVGSSQRLPGKIRVDEEVSFIRGIDAGDTPRWRVTANRTGLPLLPTSVLTVGVFNLVGADAEGFGVQVSTITPALDGSLSIRPSAQLRFVETAQNPDSFLVGDLSVHLDWWLTPEWSTSLGFSQSYGDNVATTVLFMSVSYVW